MMQVETIIAVVGAITSVAATVITAWMAVETRRMAITANKSLEIERAPILGLRDVKVELSADAAAPTAAKAVRVGVELFNAGRVPLSYRMKSISVTFGGRPTDTGTFLSRGGLVLPGSSTVFWYPRIPLDPAVEAFPVTGRVKFTFEYTDVSGSYSQALASTVEYSVSGATPGSQITWLNVDE
jgi:hypothetical protein